MLLDLHAVLLSHHGPAQQVPWRLWKPDNFIGHMLASPIAELWDSLELLRIAVTAVTPVFKVRLVASCCPQPRDVVIKAMAALLLIDFCECLCSSEHCDQALTCMAAMVCRGSPGSSAIMAHTQVLPSDMLPITANTTSRMLADCLSGSSLNRPPAQRAVTRGMLRPPDLGTAFIDRLQSLFFGHSSNGSLGDALSGNAPHTAPAGF